jgi:hypothetical protein
VGFLLVSLLFWLPSAEFPFRTLKQGLRLKNVAICSLPHKAEPAVWFTAFKSPEGGRSGIFDTLRRQLLATHAQLREILLKLLHVVPPKWKFDHDGKITRLRTIKEPLACGGDHKTARKCRR